MKLDGINLIKIKNQEKKIIEFFLNITSKNL